MIDKVLVSIREATNEDRVNVFEWFTNKDIADAMFMGELYPDNPLPTKEEFFEDYSAYFFDGSALEKGRLYIIQYKNESIGAISYSSDHLKGKRAELDIWLSGKEVCGKGYGSEAIRLLCEELTQNLNIEEFIIRPSKMNKNAIRAYKKAGFKPLKDDLTIFIDRTFHEGFGEGDYGPSNDVILIKLNKTLD